MAIAPASADTINEAITWRGEGGAKDLVKGYDEVTIVLLPHKVLEIEHWPPGRVFYLSLENDK